MMRQSGTRTTRFALCLITGGNKTVDLGFVGSCMVHKGDMKIISQMLKNLEKQHGTVEFKALLVVAPPTYNIVDELKAEGDWEVLVVLGFVFDDNDPEEVARNILREHHVSGATWMCNFLHA